MPGGADIRAGKAFVELYLKQADFVSGLNTARRHLFSFALDVASALRPSNWAKALGNEVAGLGRKMATIGTTASLAFVPTIKAASNAAETLNKFRAVFASQAEAGERFAGNLSKSLGRSKYEILDTMSAFQAFFVGMDFDPTRARAMSEQLEKLVIDFGSFFNVSDEEGMRRFLSALSGSSEVMDQFGINLKQTAMQAELLSMGIRKEWQEVTEAEKAQARFNIILKAMTAQGAVGDAERTAGSLANRLKALRGQLHDAAVEIGNALIPAVTPLVAKAVEAARAFGDWARVNPQFVASIGTAAAKLAALGAALFVVGKALAIGGSILGTVFAFGLFAKIAVVVVPLLFKLAAALRVTTISLAGLKLALTTFGPALAATSLALGGLALVLGSIAAAYINAKVQGISYGESILDLTHKITGLENAYSRLKALEKQEMSATDIVRGLETAYKNRDIKNLDESLAQLRKHRGEVESTLGGLINSDGDEQQIANLRMELERLDLIITRFAGKRGRVAIESLFRGVANDAKNIGKTIGEGLLEGMKNAWDAQNKALLEFGPDLRRARAGGIADERERELALLNAEYDERARQARVENLPTSVLEETRQQEIQNIRDRWAREDAAKQLQRDEELASNRQDMADEVAKAEIEARLKGTERERALVELERKQRLREAEAQGLDSAQINRLYDLRLSQIAAPTRNASFSGVGTFNAYQAAALQGGMSPQERAARAAERQIKQNDEANSLLTSIERKTSANALAWA